MDATGAVTIMGGFILGLSLAAPPGPINALILERGARNGWLPAFAVGGGATSGDALWCALMAFGVVHVLARFEMLRATLTLAGGALMLWFAWMAYTGARRIGRAEDAPGPTARAGLAGGYATGVLLALTSPYNLAWWISSGTALFQSLGGLVFVGFFAGIITWTASLAAVVVWARDRALPVVRGTAMVSAVYLAGFAVWLAWQGARALPWLA